MDISEIYELTSQALREMHALHKDGKLDDGQFLQNLNAGGIITRVALLAHTAELWQPREPLDVRRPEMARHLFPAEDTKSVRSVLWQFVGLGILTPRSMLDENNTFFEITQYGEQVLEEGQETAYDPLGFMKRLRRDAPRLEPDTFEFAQEAVSCFLGRHLRAAAVMTGLASENEILRLVDLYQASLNGQAQSDFESAIRGCRNLKQKFDQLYDSLDQGRSELPAEIRELDTWLQGIFQPIRLMRNDAGHPTGQEPAREEVYANLNLFTMYARRLSTLKEHLNPAT